MMKKAIFFLLISLSYCSQNKPTITDQTLAAVNNRTISSDDFAYQAQSIAQTPGVSLSTKDGRINILKDMVNEELVFQAALKDEIHLKSLDIKHEIVREYLKNKFGTTAPSISDDQVSKFYDENRDQMDQVRASHILIGIDKENKKSIPTAKAKANQVRAEIISGKITFPDAVKKYSTDTGSVGTNGDLGYFIKMKMVEPFANAAFALKKVGDISPVTESEFGFHIIQLTGEQRGIEFYREKIRWKLYQDVMQPQIDQYFKTLRESAKIQIFTEEIMKSNVPVQ